jgi:MFS family permease
MRLLISFAALLLSIALLQLSNGAIGPLDALSGIAEGFTTTQIGLLGSAHFLGFFIGCWWAPRLMGTIGHSRAFAAFAAMGAIGIVAHPIFINPNFWIPLRILSGLCIAGCYSVIEAWFQSKLTNEIRGRVMGSYRVVDIASSSIAQLMIGILPPAAYLSYNVLGILCCACVLPLTLSKVPQPFTPDAPRLHPIVTAITSPLGVIGVLVAGVTSASFRMVGPIYGSEMGLSVGQIGYFLATVLLGGAIAQFPMGYLADKYDRRWILIWLSVASVLVCTAIAALPLSGFVQIFVLAFMFGALTFPIFSVSASHANDFCDENKRIELNASLMFWYGIGAITSPLISSKLISIYGPGALFAFISVAHVGLIIFGVTRMYVRPSRTDRTRYRYMPRTSFQIGKLIRRRNIK